MLDYFEEIAKERQEEFNEYILQLIEAMKDEDWNKIRKLVFFFLGSGKQYIKEYIGAFENCLH